MSRFKQCTIKVVCDLIFVSSLIGLASAIAFSWSISTAKADEPYQQGPPTTGLVRPPAKTSAELQHEADEAAQTLLNALPTIRNRDELRGLSSSKLIERLAVQPITGPSTTASPREVPTAPAATVNWLGNGGGTIVAHPGVALLLAQRDGSGQFMPQCSGTLVGPNIVLTAAHCVCDPYETYSRADICKNGGDTVGPSKLLEPDRWKVFFQHAALYAVDSVEFDDQYRFDNQVHADLAVLILHAPVQWIKPANIVSENDSANWQAGIAAGFGYSPNPDNKNATVLQQLVRPGLKAQGNVYAADCSGLAYLTADEALCSKYQADAQGSQATICGGDSGGPLWVGDGLHMGVTSGREQPNCVAQGDFSFDMRLAYSPLAKWVRKEMQLASQSARQAKWPTFGDNLRDVLDRRQVDLFDARGNYEAESWAKALQPGVALMTINSSGTILGSLLQDQTSRKPLCIGVAGAATQLPNVDYCYATVDKDQRFRVAAVGTPGERLQFLLAWFPAGTTFDPP